MAKVFKKITQNTNFDDLNKFFKKNLRKMGADTLVNGFAGYIRQQQLMESGEGSSSEGAYYELDHILDLFEAEIFRRMKRRKNV